MGYAPIDGFISIRCGDFDIEDNFLEKEICELEKNNIDVDFHIVDIERIYKETAKGTFPHVGGCVLPEEGLIITIASLAQNPCLAFLYDIFLLTVEKVIACYIEKLISKKNVDKNGKIEITKTNEETILKISGKIDRNSTEVAKEFIDKVFK